MKRKLGINIDSVMTSYSYYAFPQSIITADERIGSKIAEFTVLESLRDEWNTVGDIAYSVLKKSWCVVSEDRYRRNCNGCIYRKMEEEDYLSIRVDFQQYTEPWGAVNLFISHGKENILLGDNEYPCRFGHFLYDGVSLYTNGECQNVPKEKLEAPYHFVLSRRGNRVEVYAGKNKARQVAIRELELPGDGDLYIGVQVRHEENSVYPWLFSNYIQLSCDVANRDKRLEFHYGITKHWDCNIFHYFLDTNRYETSDILEMGGVKYIKKCLGRGKYLETKLDQYYISERDEYHSYHHLHQNLIYGYDDQKRCFMLVGYDRNGKLVKTQIGYADLRESLKRNRKGLFQVITYRQDGYHFRFHAGYVRKMIQEYLDGVNSSEMMQHMAPIVDRSYGMEIYDELVSDRGIEVLISDRRVAHVLWEHKLCMAERIAYLTVIGVLEPRDGMELEHTMKELADKVFDLKNILLKYQRRPEKTDADLIKQYLEVIKSGEKKCLEKLLERWKDEED